MVAMDQATSSNNSSGLKISASGEGNFKAKDTLADY